MTRQWDSALDECEARLDAAAAALDAATPAAVAPFVAPAVDRPAARPSSRTAPEALRDPRRGALERGSTAERERDPGRAPAPAPDAARASVRRTSTSRPDRPAPQPPTVQSLTGGRLRPIGRRQTGRKAGALSGKRKGKHGGATAAVPVELLLATGERLQRTGDLAAAEQAYRRVLADAPARRARHAAPRRDPRRTRRASTGRSSSSRRRRRTSAPPTLDNVGFYNNFANALRRAGRHAHGRGAPPPARRRSHRKSGSRGTTSARC